MARPVVADGGTAPHYGG